jgi:putative transposase
MSVAHVKTAHGYSERRACAVLGVNRRTCRQLPREDKDAELRERMREIAETRRRFGTPRLHVLLRREGLVMNHKRTERVYREEKLSLRLKKRNKRPSHMRVYQPGPSCRDEQWAMDFLSDALINGRRIRILTVMDLWDRSSPALEADISLSGSRVVRVLEQLRLQGRLPRCIRVDNGPEFTGKALDAWAHDNEVRLDFIRPGKPTDNGHIESFNGKVRDECLNQHVFLSLANARDSLERWRKDYNITRPHSSLDWMSPEEYYERHQPYHQSKVTNSNLVYQMG